MKVLMLGWEFPPYISGGLGTACFGLTRALSQHGVEVLFVLPRPVPDSHSQHVRLLTPATFFAGSAEERKRAAQFAKVTFLAVDAIMRPYATVETVEPMTSVDVEAALKSGPPIPGIRPTLRSVSGMRGGAPDAQSGADYTGDLFTQVNRYAHYVAEIVETCDFDVIHAHDWMTYPAGILASRLSGKPLVVHVHSTEFDRSGINVSQAIYDIERAGMQAATRVITVSYLTKTLATRHYAVPPEKVDVVYNAIDHDGDSARPIPQIRRNEKIVLFLGRITMQKGPEYFVRAAKKVLEVMEDVRFIMAGSGDMVRSSIELAESLGIGDKVLFTGFLRGPDVERVFRMADLYVMPSVSEPFGIAPLEAIMQNVPVLISKQSGVSEILTHALKVDFWDIGEMANKIVAVLRHPPLHATLHQQSSFEVSRLRWADSARGCVQVYEKALAHSVAPV
jgi:glycosyltransferase involved in cell wall biosynthesis